MGLFDSSETTQQKERIKKMRANVEANGLSSMIDPSDYQKVIIEQNDAMINLLATNTIAVSGLAGDALTLVHLNRYYKAIENLSKK
jgi:hypothetical protein